MKYHERFSGNQLDQAREALTIALDNQEYISYASGDGPLTIDQVSPQTRTSDNFTQVVGSLGWPNRLNAVTEPIPEYSNNKKFIEAFIGKVNETRELQNFINLITIIPDATEYSRDEPSEAIWARTPVIHRINAIMPDTTKAVGAVLGDMKQRHTSDEMFLDVNGLTEELSLGVNNDLVSAAYMMYRTMRRLVTIDDNRLHRALVLPTYNASQVTDVTSVLEILRA